VPDDLPSSGVPDEELPPLEGIEEAIGSHRLGRSRRVQKALKRSRIYALGFAAGAPIPGGGTMTQSVQWIIPTRRRHYLTTPLFTRASFIRAAVQRHPDWLKADIVEMVGHELLATRDPAMNLVLNPGTRCEFIVPARRRRDRVKSLRVGDS